MLSEWYSKVVLSTSYPRIEALRILECADPRNRKLYTQWQCVLPKSSIRAFDRQELGIVSRSQTLTLSLSMRD